MYYINSCIRILWRKAKISFREVWYRITPTTTVFIHYNYCHNASHNLQFNKCLAMYICENQKQANFSPFFFLTTNNSNKGSSTLNYCTFKMKHTSSFMFTASSNLSWNLFGKSHYQGSLFSMTNFVTNLVKIKLPVFSKVTSPEHTTLQYPWIFMNPRTKYCKKTTGFTLTPKQGCFVKA